MLPGMKLLLRIANSRCLPPSVLFGAQGQWNPASCSVAAVRSLLQGTESGLKLRVDETSRVSLVDSCKRMVSICH